MIIEELLIGGEFDDEHELSRTNPMETTDVQKFTLGLGNSNNTALANIIAKRLQPSTSILAALLASQASLIQLVVTLVTEILRRKR